MGPIVIFDKSFLQSLTIDESVWLDNFFISNICPIFFSETLADLDKSVRTGRTPEQEVRIIASKTPEMSIAINTFHQDLCFANLNGYEIKMDRRPIISGGKPVQSKDKKGFVFEPSPEAKAFERWQNEDFLSLERESAKLWRDVISKADFDSVTTWLKQSGIDIPICKNLTDAKCKAEEILDTRRDPLVTMKLIFLLLGAPPEHLLKIYYSWGRSNCPPIKIFSPYVYHVLTVELFFYISTSSGLISAERKTNKIDISYLFYAPFCNIFVSSDKLHKRSAPIFMSENQEFVWGLDLKNDLKKLNEYYDSLPEKIKEYGLHAFATYPPKEGEFLVSKLWDKYLPKWRTIASSEIKLPQNMKESKLPESIKEFANGKELKPEEVDFEPDQADAMVFKRMVKQKKGKWYQIGKDIEINN